MSSSPKPPKPVDPTQVIQAQEQANRYDINGPFGSQTWGTGPDGKATRTTTLSPQVQGMFDRGFGLASQNLTPLNSSKSDEFKGLQNHMLGLANSYQQPPQNSEKGTNMIPPAMQQAAKGTTDYNFSSNGNWNQ